MIFRTDRPMFAAMILMSLAFFSTMGVSRAAPVFLTDADARHLLIRTGFAPTQKEVDRITGQSADRAVADLIARARSAQAIHPPPSSVFGSLYVQSSNGIDLKAWWTRELIESPTPLAERMVLFWHGHFPTAMQKVRPRALWNQHQLLRMHALGSFRTLLHAVAKDPAMLLYLDGAESRKGAPNENFAREVMELFTLGEATLGQGFGGYTEKDIKEAARAFTGWGVDREDFSFRLRPDLYDSDVKTILGHTGNFDGDAVLDILLEQPATARFLISKLWKEFISPRPDMTEVERIAKAFRESHYDISVALQHLLLSDAFWGHANRGVLIKSPIDLVVGTVRQFGFASPDVIPLVRKADQLGHSVFDPPNVKGWPGYTHWISAFSLMERKRFTDHLFRAAARNVPPLALHTWLNVYGASVELEPPADVKQRLTTAVLVVPPTRPIAEGIVGAAYVRLLTLDLAYQLK